MLKRSCGARSGPSRPETPQRSEAGNISIQVGIDPDILLSLTISCVVGTATYEPILLSVIAQVVCTFACGVFFGAAVYINLVEQPARISCGTNLAVTQWRPTYKRPTMVQVPLALIGSLSAFIAWRLEGRAAWLVGGLLLLLVIPFTIVVILPTNKQLESQELDLRSEEAVHPGRHGALAPGPFP